MLKRLYADNFRCLSNFVLEPARVSVLVGPNGSGKSAVFDALRSIQHLLNGGEQIGRVFPTWSVTRWDTRAVQRVELDVEHSGETFHYELQVSQDLEHSQTKIESEQLTVAGKTLFRFSDGVVELYGDGPATKPQTTFPFVGDRSFLPLLESRQDTRRIASFKGWLSGLFLFSLNPWTMAAVSQEESGSIAIDGSNFVSWYRTLVQESPELISRLRDDLAPVVTGLDTIRLRNVGLNARALSLECRVDGRKFELNVNELSDGQRVLLALYAVLRAVAPHASVMVFDEPDNFVAQSEIQPWLSALRETVTEASNGTLLVISHHPEVIDYLAADEALYLWRTDEGPTRVKKVADELDRSEGILASEWLKLGAGGD